MRYGFSIIVVLTIIFIIFQLDGKNSASVLATTRPNNEQQNQLASYWHKLADKTQAVFNKFYSLQRIPIATFNDRKGKYNNKLTIKKSNIFTQKTSSSNLVITPHNVSPNSTYIPNLSNIQTYIYISEVIGNDIIRCKLEQSNVSDCKVVLNNLMGPQGMVIIDDRFYLVTYTQPTLFSCDLSSSGDIEGCTRTLLPTTTLAYMIYNNYSLYITSMNFKNTVECNLDYSLLVQNCRVIPSIIPPDLVNSSNQLFGTAHYSKYTYLTLYNSKIDSLVVNKCIESMCSVLHDPHLSGPNSIKILNNTAYLTDGNTNNLVSCVIQANGDFAPCKVLKSGLKTPVAIALYYTAI